LCCSTPSLPHDFTLHISTFRYTDNSVCHFRQRLSPEGDPELTVERHSKATSEGKCTCKEALPLFIPSGVIILPCALSAVFQLRILCSTDGEVTEAEALRQKHVRRHIEALHDGAYKLPPVSVIMLVCRLLAGRCQCENNRQSNDSQVPTASSAPSITTTGPEDGQRHGDRPNESGGLPAPTGSHRDGRTPIVRKREPYFYTKQDLTTAKLSTKITLPLPRSAKALDIAAAVINWSSARQNQSCSKSASANTLRIIGSKVFVLAARTQFS
jgi:hypothetical protein